MQPHHAMPILEGIIYKMIKGLESYAARDNANTNYIEYQNGLIRELVAVHDSLNDYTVNPLGEWLTAEIYRLETIDPSISGHNIILRTKPAGDNFSFINKTFYSND